jgi:DNA mismatch repair protein MutH
MIDAPASREDLLLRARRLAGRSLGDVADHLAVDVAADTVRTKGKFGALLERVLGATGTGATRDFPAIEVELKTVPIGARGPIESTYVCHLPLADAERAAWSSSWARAKLSCVLWIPIWAEDADWRRRKIGRPLLWAPTPEQDAILAHDFDEIVGAIGAGHVEALTARTGRWLQLRPKAAHGRVRTTTRGPDGEVVSTVPKGLYLRARFTAAILRDPEACPG